MNFLNKKMKYSTFSLLFLCVVIALVIVINSIISVIGTKKNWYWDMTEEQVYSISDELVKTLSAMDENAQVEIIFATEKDNVEKNYSSMSSGAIAFVCKTAELLAEEFDNISVSYRDIIKDPKFFKDNFKNEAGGQVTNNESIIVARKTANGYGEYLSLQPISFFASDENNTLYAYNGEYVFASAILSVSQEGNPKAYFTNGHGEGFTAGEETELTKQFSSNGFSVVLTSHMENEETLILSQARVLVISNPKADFTVKEIEILEDFLRSGKSVFCFTDYDKSEDLPVLYSFFESYGGVTVGEKRLSDGVTSASAYPYSLKVQVPTNTATQVYFSGLLDYSMTSMVQNTVSLTIDPSFNETQKNVGGAGRQTLPLFDTYASATDGTTQQSYHVMTATSSVNGDGTYAYLVVCPSASFVSETFMTSSAYSNAKAVRALIQTTTSLQVPIDLTYKAFAQYNLDISDRDAKTLTAVLALVPPMIVALVGTVVLVRRKRR